MLETEQHLSDAKRALLEKYLQGKRPTKNSVSLDTIKKHNQVTNAPLSFAQQQMWLLAQIIPDSPVYNESVTIHIPGKIDTAILEQSLDAFIQRHEVWRTTFPVIDGQAVQLVHPELHVHIPVIDLRDRPLADRESEAIHIATEQAQHMFSLTELPLLRATLVHVDDHDHRLYLTLHHIIFDGTLNEAFLPELSAFYTAFAQGETPQLEPLPFQYADFALWQREHLHDAALADQLAYWKTQLAHAATLELPTDYQRPSRQTYNGHRVHFSLPADLTSALKTLSKKENVTLYMTLVASFNVLWHRYTGQDDIVIGSTSGVRKQKELQQLVGIFANALVLRMNLAGDPSFLDVLKRVRGVMLDADLHSDVPFEYLVKELNIERDAIRNPLFQVNITQEISSSELPSGWTLAVTNINNHTAKFDMDIVFDNRPDSIGGWIEYNTDLWREDTVQHMVQHWQTLLKSVVADASLRISTLPILSKSAYQQQIVDWNDTTVAYPAYTTIAQLFELQVDAQPDDLAVTDDSEQVSYRELNARANQVAHALRKQQVGADTLVGICMDRTTSMVVALLAVLKAGAAYVPIDPAYPTDRIAYMLEDSQIKCLLTQEAFSELLPATTATVIKLDSEWEQIAQESTENLPHTGSADDLAYVIYTSGSTGRSKGVQIPQHALINFQLAMRDLLGIKRNDSLLAITTLSFDIAGLEIYLPLITGAQVTIAPRVVASDGAQLLAKIQTVQPTFLQATPVTWRMLLQAGLSDLSNLTILCGGETLPEDVRDQLLACQPAAFWNVYGPTETTIWSLASKITSSETPITIGRPIANTRVYVLDAQCQLLPVGVPGELYIGGAGLARGYLHQEDLTREKFIADPFSADPTARLYRTGDLVSYQPDGTLHFRGRIDYQVKIRGFRIELGEIETVLQQLPNIQQAVVVAREDTPDDKRLVAYLIADGEQPTVDNLRQEIKNTLPDYMLPAAFVFLTKFPLTPNGKIDRRALPAPDTTDLRQGTVFVAPRNPVEEMLALIWMELLHLPQAGMNDNFFALGGHSLLATQMVSRIRETLHVDITLPVLFQNPTIAALAQEIRTAKSSTIPEIVPLERPEAIPASFAQQRLWFLYQLNQQNTGYNLPVTLRLEGPLSLPALEQSLTNVIQRHEILRTTFTSKDGQAFQIIAPAMPVTISPIDLQDETAEAAKSRLQQIAQQENQQPFDLEKGPLLRVKLLRFSEQNHVLLFNFHHIVFDGWSDNILFTELATFYQELVEQLPHALPALPIQYADYALWQNNWLQGEVLQDQTRYWNKQLANTPTLVTLPSDRPRPAVQTSIGASRRLLLSPELQQKLQTISQREGVTLFMTLLSAFQVLLMRSSGNKDIVVGTPIANRTNTELEHLIGFFVNTLALRTDLSDNPSFKEVLARVRETTLQAFAHQDLPFEKLVETLQIERSLSYTPIFQVLFVMQNMPQEPLHQKDISWHPIDAGNSLATFDITCEIIESEQGLMTHIDYNVDLYDDVTIQRFLDHWQVLLEALVEDQQQHVDDIQLVTAAERKQLLVDWNPPDDTVGLPLVGLHQLIEQQVARTPDAVAIVFEGQQLTYYELECRANQLAHRLQHLGIGPDVRVAVAMERSTELMIGLLGILKAGGAYLPLNLSDPADRLALVIEEAQPELVLTHTPVHAKLPEVAIPVLCLNDEWDTITQESETQPESSFSLQNVAYMIYTSGSTGRPKGVMITHEAICQRIQWMQVNYQFQQHDVIMNKTTVSFDPSVWELFTPLHTGSRLVLVHPQGHTDQPYLLSLIQQEQVSVLNSSPSAILSLMQEPGWDAHTGSLKWISCGGESLPSEMPEQLALSNPEVVITNFYGPTEAAIMATYWMIKKQNEDQPIPIGHPISDTQIYILDASMQPVPIGVEGEVYIGGIGLARGYFQRPDLSAERFVPNPLSTKPGERLYKTGDIAYYRNDGAIIFIGRVDHQVKIRGFRIEIGEIETAINQHPGIQQAFVMVREDHPGDKRLVAYIVLKDEQLTSNTLRTALKGLLPEYMVPSAFVFLDAFPLTSNDKIDRKALPAPDLNRTTADDDYVAPSDIEHFQLLTIWEELLTIRPIGIRDNFFHLGGHSLLAARLVSRIEQIFGKRIALTTLFTAPTIEDLALVLKQQDQSEQQVKMAKQTPLVSVQLVDSKKKPFFYLHGDWTGGAFHCFKLAKEAGTDQPFYALEPFVFEEGPEIPTIESMAASYLKIVRSVQPEGPYYLGGYCNGGLIAYEMALQLKNAGEEIDLLALVDPSWGEPAKMYMRLFGGVLHLKERQQWKLYLELRHIYIRKMRPIIQKIKHSVDQQLLDGIQLLLDRDETFKRLHPSTQTLRKDYSTIFAWALQQYEPDYYDGKVIHYWARDEKKSELIDPWMNKIQMKETVSHIIPGTHYTILTDEIQTFAERLGTDIKEAQERKR